MKTTDVIVLGGGAAGLFCALTAGQRGKKVILLEHNTRLGNKILISGGGRCNFTNTDASPKNYLSENPHFCISALANYTPYHFLELIQKHRIEYFEKKDGQLFCKKTSRLILDMLHSECQSAQVKILTGVEVKTVKRDNLFTIETNTETFQSESLVIATGGLSFKNLGASPFGYEIAKQFGHTLIPATPALVPLVWNQNDLKKYASLTGISAPVIITVNHTSFEESLLFTHKGLSGPAILQISSYWNEGDEIKINFLPQKNWNDIVKSARAQHARKNIKNWLKDLFADRLGETFYAQVNLDKNWADLSKGEIDKLETFLTKFSFKPMGTEGYSKAEVTRGGVNTRELSSKTMESKLAPGLYFIGEVMDVTGWLGGYNFQWAWASAFAAGNSV